MIKQENIIKTVDVYDAHDRMKSFTGKGDFNISECCADMIAQRPFGMIPFYIYVHPRTDDDGFRKRLIWQPRLTKPKAGPNTMLFKAYPGSDEIKIIWMIPQCEMWSQYGKGKVTQSDIVMESIHKYLHNKAELEDPEKDDLSDEQIDKIYTTLSLDAKLKKPFSKI